MALSAAPRRIGILGGAFDPPHVAHVALAQAACAQFQLHEIRIIPTGQAWHKPRPLSDAVHRLAMAQLAFESLPQALVDARETRRSGPSYTVDTLRELRTEQPDAQWFLVMGADQARALHTWQSWPEIVQSATICVAQRPHATPGSGEFHAQKAFPGRFRHLDLPAMTTSATAIRAAVFARQDVTALVGQSVARYIADHHLYQTV